MQKNKISMLDTEKPLGNPNGLRMALVATLALSIGLETKVAMPLIAKGNYSALAYLFLLSIILYIPIISNNNMHIFENQSDNSCSFFFFKICRLALFASFLGI